MFFISINLLVHTDMAVRCHPVYYVMMVQGPPPLQEEEVEVTLTTKLAGFEPYLRINTFFKTLVVPLLTTTVYKPAGAGLRSICCSYFPLTRISLTSKS